MYNRYIYICIIDTYIYVCIYVCMYVYTHTHTHGITANMSAALQRLPPRVHQTIECAKFPSLILI